MMGRVFMAKAEYAKAVESLQRVISQDRELVSETLEMLQTCYQLLGKTAEWAEFCSARWKRTPVPMLN